VCQERKRHIAKTAKTDSPAWKDNCCNHVVRCKVTNLTHPPERIWRSFSK
jgi:hypothetical protein